MSSAKEQAVVIGHHTVMQSLEEAMTDSLGLLDGDEYTTHWHCNGSYVREVFLPKNHIVTGKVHRYACINIVLSGKVIVVQSDGRKTVEAPYIYISEPGEKKALYALEDTRFLNVHATEETDQELLEAEFTVPEHALLEFYESTRLEEK